jgi:GNAT superfamily N-acetyltransferase
MTKIMEGTEKDAELLDNYIREYNLSKIPYPKNPPWDSLHFVIKENDMIIAGITSYLIMNNTLSVDVLYVAEDYRGQGYGKMLLNHAEQEAKRRGAYLVQLDTFDFQGLEFYKKQGYVIFGTLNDSPARGHERYYLKKDL